jgi:hypothetical protein
LEVILNSFLYTFLNPPPQAIIAAIIVGLGIGIGIGRYIDVNGLPEPIKKIIDKCTKNNK